MPRKPEPTPTPWARAVADTIRKEIDARGISGNDLGTAIGRSGNYVAIRFRYEASFTVTDLDEIARFLNMDAAQFVVALRSDNDVIEFPVRNVRPTEQDGDTRPKAATDDNSQAIPDQP